jgi:D-beta-D-heptose 7-phosphate kinase / D-beta-D-heptose 1-phosphate adenosyltransferase
VNISGPVVVIGDVLLDVDLVGPASRLAPDAPVPVVTPVAEHRRPGGAGLVASWLSRRRSEVVLVAPFADDEAADEIAVLLGDGIELIRLAWAGTTPVKTRVRADDHAVVRIDRGGAVGLIGPWPATARTAVAGASAVVVADYGLGVTAQAELRQVVGGHTARVPIVWDPHPRGAEPVAGVRLVTPNEAEAQRLTPSERGTGWASAGRRAAQLVRRWSVGGVAVTLGRDGALLSVGDGAPLVVPAPVVRATDPCGAGDAFAAAAADALARGALPSEAVQAAVHAASEFVAGGGVSSVARSVAAIRPRGTDAMSVIEATRAAGGRIVATGGCFDIVHAGHVATLQAARSLGDCLVVCLNSDASVRRLKGPGRPLQAEEDRRRVLSALQCVDAVEVFEEDTPTEVLTRLRPDLWVKGGDYAGVVVPEAAIVERWGGEAVALPYLAGRSTSALVESARLGVDGGPSAGAR